MEYSQTENINITVQTQQTPLKFCSKCKTLKPQTEFYPGFAWCKSCKKQYIQDHKRPFTPYTKRDSYKDNYYCSQGEHYINKETAQTDKIGRCFCPIHKRLVRLWPRRKNRRTQNID